MIIREIISKLENIEIELSKKGIDSECEMVAELIDDIIADDLALDINPVVSDFKVLETLIEIGIKSGQIGQA